jgi:hypothetical protein
VRERAARARAEYVCCEPDESGEHKHAGGVRAGTVRAGAVAFGLLLVRALLATASTRARVMRRT